MYITHLSHYAALSGRIRDTSSLIASAVSHKSIARCAFNQNSGELPKSRTSLRAISGLTARRSRNNSLMGWRETPTALTSSETDNP